MQLEDKHFPVNRTATMGGVVLVDPATKKPYKAGVTIQQVDGGFDPTGLATDDKQDEIVLALEELLAAVKANTSNGDVSIADAELPPVAGGATSAKQDSILAALQNLAGVLNGTLNVTATNPIPVTAENVPLATGASTATKQDAILAAVNALAEVFRTETLDVSGSVDVNGTVPVSGSVSLSNASIAVTPSGAFTVDIPGSATSAKQDAILTALGNVLTAIQAPHVVTDGGQSITVDGVVGVSGTVPVTQSGTWNVGVTGTPNVNISNTSVPVSGSVSLSGTPSVTIANTAVPVSGSVGINGTVPVTVGNSSLPVTQSGTWNVNTLRTNAATLTTGPTAISVGTTSVQLAASNANRKSVIIQNMGGTNLALSFAATAVATAPTMIVPANNWVSISRGTWTGVVTAIRPSGSATADAVVTVVS